MPAQLPLTADEAVERVLRHLRKRIQVLEDVRLSGNAATIHELKNLLNLLERCHNYIRNESRLVKRS